jgi:hypothetical protein
LTIKVKHKRGTASAITAANPTLAAGELAFETDTRRFKLGDGTTAWTSLAYVTPYVSATDRLLGRSSAGAGVVEEITCTSFARSILDDASAADVRSTLSVQPTASPAFTGAATFDNTGNVVPLTVTNTGTANSFVVNDASGDTTPFVIDASGVVLIGLSASVAGTAQFQIAAASNTEMAIVRTAAPASTNSIAGITCTAYDGSAYVAGGTINFRAAENWSSTNHGTDIQFRTTPTGSGGALAEAMRITGGGVVLVGASSAPSFSGATPNLQATQASFTGSDADGGTIATFGSSTFGIDKGSGVVFGFKYNTAGNYVTAARTRGAKENATDGNYAGYIAFDTRANGGNLTERMRIDSSGNVGIGTSSPDPSTKLNVAGAYPSSGTVTRGIMCNGTVPSGSTVFGDGVVSFLATAAASFTCANLRHFVATQATLGAGSSVTNQYGYVVESTLTGATNNYGFYSNIGSGAGRYNFYAAGTAENYFAGVVTLGGGSASAPILTSTVGTSDTGLWFPAADQVAIACAGATALLVNASGEILIGGVSDQGNFKLQASGNTYLENLYLSTTTNWGRLAINHAGATTFAAGWNNTDTTSTGQTTLNILRNGTSVGTISTTNAATSYNTTSDYRLKRNPRRLENATERLARIKPSQWDWHVGGGGEGFMAHELRDAVPLAVTGEKDAVDENGRPVWQTVDMSKVVPLLVAALQESNARIVALEERLNHA